MTRKLLLTALIGVVAFGARAQSATSDYQFTYADPAAPLSALGDRAPMGYDVAILIDNPSLKGWTIKKITAYTNAWQDVSNTSVWLSDKLTLSGDQANPSITKQEVTPVQGAYGGDSELGMMSAELDEPYTLTGAPVYVGYSLTVDKLSGTGQQYPVLITKNYNENGLFYHSVQGITTWTDYSNSGCAAIIVTLEKGNQEYSLGINSVNPVATAPGETFNIFMNLCNVGQKNVSEISYTYSYEGSSEQMTGSVTLQTPIKPDPLSTTQVAFPMNPMQNLGKQKINFSINAVDGQTNANQNASKEIDVTVYEFLPVHRPLIEEFTALGCGWCPRGWLALEMINEEYGDAQTSISYHNSEMFGYDPMAVTNVYPVTVTGLPMATIDRNGTLDPYYGTSANTQFGIADNINDAINSLAIAEINGTARLEGDLIKVSTETRFITDISNANYRVGYVLTDSGLTGEGWLQSNYFASPQYRNQFTGTPLEVLTTMSTYIKDLDFNFVAVDVTGMNGVSGSLPSKIEAGQTYTYDFTIDIAGNELVQHRSLMQVVFFVINKTTGGIVNSNKYIFSAEDGVESVWSNEEAVATEYYDLTGRKVQNPDKGLFIRTERTADGKTRSSKVLFR